jgi:hypothetical protein
LRVHPTSSFSFSGTAQATAPANGPTTRS